MTTLTNAKQIEESFSKGYESVTICHGNLVGFNPITKGWEYISDGEPHNWKDKPRACNYCEEEPFWCEKCKEYHDACLGHLEGIAFCCCGHGSDYFQEYYMDVEGNSVNFETQ